jgi:hypothetical protein
MAAMPLARIARQLAALALLLSSPSSMLIRLISDGLFHFADPSLNGLSSFQLCQLVFQICDGFFSMAYSDRCHS